MHNNKCTHGKVIAETQTGGHMYIWKVYHMKGVESQAIAPPPYPDISACMVIVFSNREWAISSIWGQHNSPIIPTFVRPPVRPVPAYPFLPLPTSDFSIYKFTTGTTHCIVSLENITILYADM